VTPVGTLGSDSRTVRRIRSRSSTCTQAAPEPGSDRRAGGFPTGGRLTLGQLLDGVWEGLSAGGTAACPVCRAQMGATPGPAFRCEGCGTELS